MKKHLYDEIAKRWHRGCSIWVYSDPHFKGEEIKTFRTNYIGDDEQVKRINSKVGKSDTIIFLGDIGDLEFIKKIRGYKVLIMGNHDKGASNYKRQKLYDLREDNCTFKCVGDNHLFDEVYEGPLMINDRVILSHEPIPVPNYMFNIHGHVHNKNYKGDSQHLNCCAEAINYEPVNIIKLMDKGLLKDIKDIHRCAIDKRL